MLQYNRSSETSRYSQRAVFAMVQQFARLKPIENYMIARLLVSFRFVNETVVSVEARMGIGSFRTTTGSINGPRL